MIIGPIDIHNIIYEYKFDIMKETTEFLEEMKKDNINARREIIHAMYESDSILLESEGVISKFFKRIKEMFMKAKEFIYNMFKKFKTSFSNKQKESNKIIEKIDAHKELLDVFKDDFEYDGIEYTLDNRIPHEVNTLLAVTLNKFKITLSKADIMSEDSMNKKVESFKKDINKAAGKLRGDILDMDFIDINDKLEPYLNKAFIKGGSLANTTKITVNKEKLKECIDRTKKSKQRVEILSKNANEIQDSFDRVSKMYYDEKNKSLGLLQPDFVDITDNDEKNKAINMLVSSTDYLSYVIKIVNQLCKDNILAFNTKVSYMVTEYGQDLKIIDKAFKLSGFENGNADE